MNEKINTVMPKKLYQHKEKNKGQTCLEEMVYGSSFLPSRQQWNKFDIKYIRKAQ